MKLFIAIIVVILAVNIAASPARKDKGKPAKGGKVGHKSPHRNATLAAENKCYAKGFHQLTSFQQRSREFRPLLEPLKKLFTGLYEAMDNFEKRLPSKTEMTQAKDYGFQYYTDYYLYTDGFFYYLFNAIEEALVALVELLACLLQFIVILLDVLCQILTAIVELIFTIIGTIILQITEAVAKITATDTNTRSIDIGLEKSVSSFLMNIVETPVSSLIGVRSMEKIAKKFSTLYTKYFTFMSEKMTRFVQHRELAKQINTKESLSRFVKEFKDDIDQIHTFHKYLDKVSHGLEVKMDVDERDAGLERYI